MRTLLILLAFGLLAYWMSRHGYGLADLPGILGDAAQQVTAFLLEVARAIAGWIVGFFRGAPASTA